MNQLHIERCLPDGFLAAALRADARGGPHRGAEDAAAQVVL